jgi:3-oxoisoapionate kinase
LNCLEARDSVTMLYTFYGDDFTGSTDVLEQLASNGVQAVLFLRPPTEKDLGRFEGFQAIGIAGDSRSRSPEWMSENLPSIFTALKRFHAPVNHYKVCSTFDSSPTHGSIGRAIELGREVFGSECVPVVVAAMHLGRYVVFGNLFAAAPDGSVQRIDRHPMAHHPVTPMREADLRLHLGAQAGLSIGLIDLKTIESGRAMAEFERLLGEKTRIVVFDGVDEQSSSVTGDLIWSLAQQSPVFSASSSGLTAALVRTWRDRGDIYKISSPERTSANSRRLLAFSGSCSAVTTLQIRSALDMGFHGIPVEIKRLLDPATTEVEVARLLDAALTSLVGGRDTILYTALGTATGTVPSDTLGRILGHLLREIISTCDVRRVLLCGGDTSSHVMQQLDLYALTWVTSIQTGAPLCRGYSGDLALDGLELVLKGGQVGNRDFFDDVRRA